MAQHVIAWDEAALDFLAPIGSVVLAITYTIFTIFIYFVLAVIIIGVLMGVYFGAKCGAYALWAKIRMPNKMVDEEGGDGDGEILCSARDRGSDGVSAKPGPETELLAETKSSKK